MEAALAYLLDLRIRCRGNRHVTALVDRCLSLLARAETAEGGELQHLEAEVEAIRAELAERFGPPPDFLVH